jgi:glutamate N-acetyltransferase / amino-acid N-acetyltransferase
MGTVNLSQTIDLDRVSVSFVPADGSAPLPVLVNGEPENVDEVRAKEILSKDDFEINVQMGLGNESARYWTCDFSYVSRQQYLVTAPNCYTTSQEYVRINGDYRS